VRLDLVPDFDTRSYGFGKLCDPVRRTGALTSRGPRAGMTASAREPRKEKRRAARGNDDEALQRKHAKDGWRASVRRLHAALANTDRIATAASGQQTLP
jgi:hypothetical protein